jgi:hypothetical protein
MRARPRGYSDELQQWGSLLPQYLYLAGIFNQFFSKCLTSCSSLGDSGMYASSFLLSFCNQSRDRLICTGGIEPT